ncbi:hypothetical protein [Streptomyces soliscabiei]|uniref:hypothetical protein n=1 Tax=Streptomyces soliscabiei TaxID=588897 RepID=UPI0029A544C6|nr:hypothetical protein [Streptomyces sp. NY05-11A]MDX2679271.1 hypothetical protein [Streptomyces sp. NY05-11A]
MTPNEITYLLCGAALGSQGMNVLWAYWASKDARRSATASQAAWKRAAGDRYLSSLRLYQLQHRSPV